MEFSRPKYCSRYPFHSPRDLPNPEIKPRYPALQPDYCPTEPQGKSKNTGVDNLSLLQWIFLTQESNWGLLHCRQILYQLSYQESYLSSNTRVRVHCISVNWFCFKLKLFYPLSWRNGKDNVKKTNLK